MPVKQVVHTDGVLRYEQFGFTNCVRFGDVLYLSGISALDHEGIVTAAEIEEQAHKTFENIGTVLVAGGSSLGQILQMTSFVVDLRAQRCSLRGSETGDPVRTDVHQRGDRSVRTHDSRAPPRGAGLRRRLTAGRAGQRWSRAEDRGAAPTWPYAMPVSSTRRGSHGELSQPSSSPSFLATAAASSVQSIRDVLGSVTALDLPREAELDSEPDVLPDLVELLQLFPPRVGLALVVSHPDGPEGTVTCPLVVGLRGGLGDGLLMGA